MENEGDFEEILEEKKTPLVKTSDKTETNTPKPLSDSQLKRVKKEFEASVEYQKMDKRQERWHDHREYLNCRWDDEGEDEESVNINTLWSNAQTELPDLYFRQPTVTLTPESDFFEAQVAGQTINVDNFQACKLFQIRLNNVVKNMRIESIWDHIIMDTLCPFGYGVGKIGFALTTETPWTNEYDIKTSYWFKRLDPRNITFDLIADDFSGLVCTYERIARSRADMITNNLYDNKKIREMRKLLPTDNSMPAALKARMAKAGKDYDPDFICFVEMHDMKDKCIRWLDLEGEPQEIRKPIRRKRWFEGSDYIFTSLNTPTDDNVYPLSDADPIIEQALSRNKTRTAIEGHIRNWGTTIIVPDDIPEDKLEVYKVVKDRLILRLPRDLMQGIVTQSPPPISGDWYRLDEMDRRDNSDTLGLPDYMTGSKGQTATHDTLSDNRYTKRINRRRRKIQLSILEMYRKIAGLIQEYDRGDTRLNVSEYVDDQEFIEFIGILNKARGAKTVFDPKKPFVSASREWWQIEAAFDYEIEEQLDRPKAVQIQQLNGTIQQVTANPFLNRALFDDPKTPKKIVQKMFELQGMNLQELKTRQTFSDIPPAIENEIVEFGDPTKGAEAKDMPIPLPCEKNNDAEHIVTHYRLMQEMQQKLQLLMIKEIKQPIDIMVIEFLNKSIAKLQKHLMLHDLQMKQKEQKDTMAFQARGTEGQVPMQPQQPASQQPPNQGQMMGGGRTMV